MRRWVEIRTHNGMRKLWVDGAPFLAIGIQYWFDRCNRIRDFDYLFAHTVKMGLNTVFFPIRWAAMEAREGRYDFGPLDHALRRCRQHGLRMSLLWFGSNQGSFPRPAPEWVRDDKGRFPRVVDAAGRERETFCPSNPSLLAAEKRAFVALLRHLAAVDGKRHTIIMMQIENEPCLAMRETRKGAFEEMDEWIMRCHCPACDAIHARAGTTDWESGVRALGGYINSLLAAQKRIFPVLTYTNFALSLPFAPRPGNDAALYRKAAPRLDFVAPDFYGMTPGDLAWTMRTFRLAGHLPFMAEAPTEVVGETDKVLYLCVFDHGAQGYDPWAIDHSFGWRACRDQAFEKPPVDRRGHWSDVAVMYGRAARSLTSAMRQIARATGSGDLRYYISHGQPQRLEDRLWGLFWRWENGRDGKWVIVRTGPDDVTITGMDAVVAVYPVDGRRSVTVEAGRWREDRWIRAGTVPVRVLDPRRKPDARPVHGFDLADGRAFRLRLGRP